MQLDNTWITEIIYLFVQTGYLRALSYPSFLKRGRGAVLCHASDKRFQATYFCRVFWTKMPIDEGERNTILNSIDTYNPSSQAVVVTWATYQNAFELSTQLVTLV